MTPTRDCQARDAALSTRSRHSVRIAVIGSTRIAREADANLALMNYYFGSKQGLLLAIYDSLERKKFARQDAMYAATDESLSAKWRRAVDFYRQDLADGFVRLQMRAPPGTSDKARVQFAVSKLDKKGGWEDLPVSKPVKFSPVCRVKK